MSDATLTPTPILPQAPDLPRLHSGSWSQVPAMQGYRAEWLEDMFVERVVWTEDAHVIRLNGVPVAGPGYTWFRFWLPAQGQVVERYFDQEKAALGSYVPLCAPLERDPQGYSAVSLLLSLWLPINGRVMVMDEQAFEEAVVAGRISPAQAEFAEGHIRILTAAIAQGSFPPALVRNLALA